MTGEITFLQSATAYIACMFVAISFSLTFKRGREFLHKIFMMFSGKPVESTVLFILVSSLSIIAGTKGGGVVTEKGIDLVSVMQTPESVMMEWVVADGRIPDGAVFNVQEYRGDGIWFTLASTTNHSCVIPKFTISEHHQWRIMTEDIKETAE